MKSAEELKALHGKEYAKSFAKTQSPKRLERLIKFIHVNEPGQKLIPGGADFRWGIGVAENAVNAA